MMPNMIEGKPRKLDDTTENIDTQKDSASSKRVIDTQDLSDDLSDRRMRLSESNMVEASTSIYNTNAEIVLPNDLIKLVERLFSQGMTTFYREDLVKDALGVIKE